MKCPGKVKSLWIEVNGLRVAHGLGSVLCYGLRIDPAFST